MAKANDSVERELLQQILGGFGLIDQDARIRILRTVSAYYELDLVKQPATQPGGSTQATRSGATREPVFSGHPSQSPKNFLFEKAPQTDVERIACLAYYLSHYRDQPHFKTADLSKLNTEAAQRKLANAAYAANNAAQSGYLAGAPGGQKQLTALGEQYVTALPDRDAARAVVERLRDRKPRKKDHPSKKYKSR